ncbi:hypothetical protein CDL15_Pgr008386 [Punica granatum]|uniref:RING-type domain-containing protein n=1 Tax=Punica granatum TaxID=22663 RepID=A0A218WMQ7_PUNGR|nr:hypothetical protein CDL15_Pgr008386 [Punica granatum]
MKSEPEQEVSCSDAVRIMEGMIPSELADGSFLRLSCSIVHCIGSAFNSKRVMECPNCREVEAGQWRFSEVRPMPAPRRLGEALEEMREAASDMNVVRIDLHGCITCVI